MRFIFKFLLIVIVTNLLVACENPAGEPVSMGEFVSGFLFGWGEGDAGNFGNILTTLATVIGGPYGWAAGIIGTALPAGVAAYKKNKGIQGVVVGMQAARETLSEADRKVFDNAAREAMNDVRSGNPRELVRKAKNVLKLATMKQKGSKPFPSLSAKHQFKT